MSRGCPLELELDELLEPEDEDEELLDELLVDEPEELLELEELLDEAAWVAKENMVQSMKNKSVNKNVFISM